MISHESTPLSSALQHSVEPSRTDIPFENVVFSGGGVKGVAYVGVLEQLEFRGFPLSNVKRLAGTSAGAIMASLLAVGYDLDTLLELMNALDFKDLLDESSGHTREKVLKTNRKLLAGEPNVVAALPMVSVSPKLYGRLRDTGGIYHGEYLRTWLEDKLFQRTGIEHLTFAELEALVAEEPETYKSLWAVAVELDSHDERVFSAATTPDVIISDAVRCSMSIPGLFEPHYWCEKIEGERHIHREGPRFTDGGVTMNYPIDMFDNETWMNPEDLPEEITHYMRFVNPRTLGFRLKNFAKAANNNEEQEASSNLSHINAKAVMKANAKTITSIPSRLINTEENQARTVFVDSLGINTFSFDITEEETQALIESGREAVNRFLGHAPSDTFAEDAGSLNSDSIEASSASQEEGSNPRQQNPNGFFQSSASTPSEPTLDDAVANTPESKPVSKTLPGSGSPPMCTVS